MSAYQLQKLCRAVNSDAASRKRYFGEREAFVDGFGLTPEERQAVLSLDIDALYDFGVHPLLLRPFTVINGISQDDYLTALNPGRSA